MSCLCVSPRREVIFLLYVVVAVVVRRPLMDSNQDGKRLTRRERERAEQKIARDKWWKKNKTKTTRSLYRPIVIFLFVAAAARPVSASCVYFSSFLLSNIYAIYFCFLTKDNTVTRREK